MVIVSQADMQSWEAANIHVTVREWFVDNSGKWISDCLTANPSLTYEQVGWALGFIASNDMQALMALPQQDSELPLAMQLNAMYKG